MKTYEYKEKKYVQEQQQQQQQNAWVFFIIFFIEMNFRRGIFSASDEVVLCILIITISLGTFYNVIHEDFFLYF